MAKMKKGCAVKKVPMSPPRMGAASKMMNMKNPKASKMMKKKMMY